MRIEVGGGRSGAALDVRDAGAIRVASFGVGLVVTWAVVLAGAGGAQAVACPTGIVKFSSTAAEQCYTVPAGVTELAVTLVGAKGGDQGTASEGAGGNGATVTGWIPVTAGSTLYVEVGQNGVEAYNTGGGATFGGGGAAGSDGSSGGGASDIRACSMSAGSCPGGGSSIDSRLVVAGGGGGAGDIGISSDLPGHPAWREWRCGRGAGRRGRRGRGRRRRRRGRRRGHRELLRRRREGRIRRLAAGG